MVEKVFNGVFSVEFTEDELIAIEKALEHSNANTKELRLLLNVFRVPEVGRAARSAWIKVAKAQRNIALAVGEKEHTDDTPK